MKNVYFPKPSNYSHIFAFNLEMQNFMCYNDINAFVLRGNIMSFIKFSADDTLIFKKKHPCGSDRFTVLRGGTDVKIRCQGCAHEFFMSRETVEKSIKNVITKSESDT